MGLTAIKTIGTEMIGVLQKSRQLKAGATLVTLLAQLDAPETKRGALEALIAACGVRDFGDLALPNTSEAEWGSLCVRMRKKCNEELRATPN